MEIKEDASADSLSNYTTKQNIGFFKENLLHRKPMGLHYWNIIVMQSYANRLS